MNTKNQISKLLFLAALLLCCQPTANAQGALLRGFRNAVLNGAIHAIKNPPHPEPRPLPTPKPVPTPVPPIAETRIQQGSPRPLPESLKLEHRHVELQSVKPKQRILPTIHKYQDSLSTSDRIYQLLCSLVQEKKSQKDEIAQADLAVALYELMSMCNNCHQQYQEERFLILFNEIQVWIQQQFIEKHSDQ